MNIKHFMTIAGLAAGLFISGITWAQDYQWEVGFFSESEEGDVSGDEVDVLGPTVTYYFDRVSTSKGPLAEAGFLSRVSNIFFGLTNIEFTTPGFATFEGDGFALGGVYYVPKTNYYVGIATLRVDIDNTSPSEIEDDTLFGGVYLNDRSTVELSVSSGSVFGADTSGFAVAYKTLLKLSGKDVNIEAGFSNNTEDSLPSDLTNSTASLSGDYYVNKQFSVGAGFSSNSGDEKALEGTTFSFDIVYFFTPAVAIEVEVAEFSVDDTSMGEDVSTVSFDLIGRI